jgi:hypothetical protein
MLFEHPNMGHNREGVECIFEHIAVGFVPSAFELNLFGHLVEKPIKPMTLKLY